MSESSRFQQRGDMPTRIAFQVLRDIATCEEVDRWREGCQSPCSEILSVQEDANEFQVPEPWSGQIETARILFLSSNPSIDASEMYPTSSWESDRVANFFMNRFDDGHIKDGIKARQRDGTYGRSVSFWAAIKRHAYDLLLREPIPGRDYATSEVVHCKSREERGVQAALTECSGRYLDSLLTLSIASVVVVLGSVARTGIVTRYPEIFPETPQFGTVVDGKCGGRVRLIVFMPHPNARMRRYFTDTELIPMQQLERLRKSCSD
jgi:uracil-DNA glycosylase